MGIRDLRMSVMGGSTQQGHASSQPRRTRQTFFKVATVQLEESSPCQGTESILGCGGLLAAFTSLAFAEGKSLIASCQTGRCQKSYKQNVFRHATMHRSLHKLYLTLFMLSLKIENIRPTDTASHNRCCPDSVTAPSPLLLKQGRLPAFGVYLPTPRQAQTSQSTYLGAL